MNARFAQIVVVDDYHSIHEIAESIIRKNVWLKGKELGTTFGSGIESTCLKYVGVIFEGSCPNNDEITKLLDKAGVELTR